MSDLLGYLPILGPDLANRLVIHGFLIPDIIRMKKKGVDFVKRGNDDTHKEVREINKKVQ